MAYAEALQQIDNIMDISLIGVILAGILGYRIFNTAIELFINRTMKTDFITKEQFNEMNDRRTTTEEMIKSQLHELRAITLIIAMKTGIKEDDITKLVKG